MTEPQIDALEPRTLLALHPVAINFNDEAMWEENFDVAVEEAKRLGVTAVRVWLEFDDYDARPNAYDPQPEFGAETNDDPGRIAPRTNNHPLIFSRLFELDREGFSILVTPQNRIAPTTPEQVQGFYRHLLSVTETPESTVTLKDAVDYWEINNEPDLGGYWFNSKVDKSVGLASYVQSLLLPVADVLHEGDPATWEKVVLAGVSWSPNDMRSMLEQLAALNRLDAIDYAGYHPYGTYDVRNPEINEPLDRAQRASAFAEEFGKKLIITEWNIRDFPIDGSQDDLWVQAIDDTYHAAMLPYAEIAFYFAMINNWDARGGARSARPASVLVHDSPVSVTPKSTIANLKTFYSSPLERNEPFYSMVKSWGDDSDFALDYELTGQIDDSLSTLGQAPPSSRVYVDRNGDGNFDAGEPSTQTAGDGTYTLRYTTRQLSARTYTVRVEPPEGWAPVEESMSLELGSGDRANVNLSLRNMASPAYLEGSTLYVNGTSGDDVIGISKRGVRLRMVHNGDVRTFRAASVQRIEILGHDGNDVIGWDQTSVPTYVNAGMGHDLIVGGYGDDSITGAAGRDTIHGNDGDDRLNGGNTANLIFGGNGNDRIYGGPADDQIDGGAGADRVWAGEGPDLLSGGASNDRLYGEDGDDTIVGNNGNDFVIGGPGADSLHGGIGDDTAERDLLDELVSVESVLT